MIHVAAVGRKDWSPGKYSWICSKHLIEGKSNDPASPDYVFSIFSHTSNEAKRKAIKDLECFDSCKKKRLEHTRQVHQAWLRMRVMTFCLMYYQMSVSDLKKWI